MLHNIPERSVTERCFKFLDHHLKLIIQKSWSHIKNSGDLLNKTNQQNFTCKRSNAILVTINVGEFYPRIPHEVGLRVFREALNKQDKNSIPTEDLVKMVGFVLKNNFI